MRFIQAVVLITVVISMAGCRDPYQIDYTVHLNPVATVVDSATHVPLENVEIRFIFDERLRESVALPWKMTTDARGRAEIDEHYRFGGVLYSEFEKVDFKFIVRIEHAGYAPIQKSFRVKIAPKAPGPARVDFGEFDLRPLATNPKN